MHTIFVVYLTVATQYADISPEVSDATIDSLEQRLHQDNIKSVRTNALDEAAQLGPAAAPLVEPIMDMLTDVDKQIRAKAAFGLGKLGAKARAAIPTLVDMLNEDADETARAAAARALGQIGVCNKAAIVSLRKALKADEDWGVRYYSAESLASVSNNDASVATVKSLATAANQDRSPHVRGAAIRALGAIRRHPEHSVPALVKALKDTDLRYEAYSHDSYGKKPIQADAADALGMFGANADNAVQSLELQMENAQSSRARVAAAVAIIRIDGLVEKPVTVLCNVLRKSSAGMSDTESDIEIAQLEAVAGLSHLRKPTSKVLECLQEAILKRPPLVQVAVARALEAFGADAREALPTLQQLSDHDDADVRSAVRRAITSICKSPSGS